MAGSVSILGAQYQLGYLTGRALPYAATRTTYLALLTAAPSKTTTVATMSEVGTAGYARQPVLWTPESNADPTVTSNAAAITFGPFTAAMTTPATHCALVSVATGTSGDFLYQWVLDLAKSAAQNESIQFAINQLSMSQT